jgi:hypothetical protein
MVAHEPLLAVPGRISLEAIDAAVSARLGPARVAGNAQPAAFNRQVAMYLAKRVGGWSTTKIGKFYNGRDHSTVCHSIRRIESLRDENPEVDAVVSAITGEILNSGPSNSDPVSDSAGPADYWFLNEGFLDRLADKLAERLLTQIDQTRHARRRELHIFPDIS